MNILVVNCGSSSVKYSLFRMEDGPLGESPSGRPSAQELACGLVEKVGEPGSRIRHEAGGKAETRNVEAPDHQAAFVLMIEALTEGRLAVISDPSKIDAVGHRVVHGAERFAESVRIDDEVIGAIEGCAALAPLHNPANLVGIRAAMSRMPHVPHVAVFDTAFHQTLSPHAFLYAVPYDLYAEHGIRRYGFHGTSHRFVTLAAAEFLGRPVGEMNLITCHLGNGCSVTAVRGGRSVDTSMGLTPLEGLVMGTRSGDIDPAVVFHLARTLGMDSAAIDDLLNRKSGLLGVSGVSNDMREVLESAEAGNERARLAVRIFCYRLRKYIGAYTAVLGRVDALVFTGGIGENAAPIREQTCRGLESLGYVLDPVKNASRERGPRDLSLRAPCRAAEPDGRAVASADCGRRILVIPTDEEAMIARDTARVARDG